MNICGEKEKLEKLKNNANVRWLGAINGRTPPLGQDTPKGLIRDDLVNQRWAKQEYDKMVEELRLHKINCLICIS